MTRADRFVRKAHIWLGLCLGGLFVLFGATGTLLEYQRPLWAAEFGAPVANPPVPVSRWIDAARGALPPGTTLGTVMMPEGRLRTPWALVTAQDGAGAPWLAVIDPGDGSVRGAKPLGEVRALLPLRLHVSLAIDGPVGVGLTVASGLALALSALTAFLIWMRGGRLLRKATTLDIRGPPRRRNYRIHSVVGFWTSAALLALGATGAWLAQPFGFSNREPLLQERDCGIADVDSLVKAAHRLAPNAAITTIEIPSAHEGEWQLSLREAGDIDQIIGDSVLVAPANCTGMPSLVSRRSDAERAFGLVRSAHAGHVAGALGEVAVFLAGLALVVLPISGTLHWWRTRQQRPRRRGGTDRADA